MITMMRACCFIVTLLLIVNSSLALTYYASPSVGDYTNDCLSPDEPCPGIFTAVQMMRDGDQLVLAAGTYQGAANVPFSINFANITIQGDVQQSGEPASIIQCGNIYPFCAQVFIQGTIRIRNIRFTGYSPIDQRQVWNNLDNNDAEGPFQSLLLVESVVQLPNSRNEQPAEQSLILYNCYFTQNYHLANDTDNVSASSLILLNELSHYDSLHVVDSEFSNNTVSLINALHSNLFVNDTRFYYNMNSYLGLPTIISFTTHPWNGGSTFHIIDSHFSSNVGNTLIEIDGITCFQRHGNSSCDITDVTHTYFYNNNVTTAVFLMKNGAQLSLNNTGFLVNKGTIVANEGTQVSINTNPSPGQIYIQNSGFELSSRGSLVSGYFMDSLIHNCTVTAPNSANVLFVSGELTISATYFSGMQTAVAFEHGTCFIDNSTFDGFVNPLAFGSINWNQNVGSVAQYCSAVVKNSYSSSGAVTIRPTGFLFFDGNEFKTTDTQLALFQCKDFATFFSEISLIGGLNNFDTFDTLGTSSCVFVCNGDNKLLCQSSNLINTVSPDAKSFQTWQILVMLFLFIAIIWAFVVTAIIGSFVQTVIQTGKLDSYEAIGDGDLN